MASLPPKTHIAYRQCVDRVRRRRRVLRSAGVTLEAILAIPLLVIALFASFQFAMLLTVQQTLQYAAIEAARDAALLNTTSNAARLAAATATASNVLAVHGLDVCAGANDVQVITEDLADIGNEVLTCGPTVVATPTASVAANSVRVHLAVNLSSTPVPNLLDYFHFDLTGKYLYVKSDAIKEYP